MEDFKAGDLVYRGTGSVQWRILQISKCSGGGDHQVAWLENPSNGKKTVAYLDGINHKKQWYKEWKPKRKTQ